MKRCVLDDVGPLASHWPHPTESLGLTTMNTIAMITAFAIRATRTVVCARGEERGERA